MGSEHKGYWPTIIPLPIDRRERERLVTTLFSSKLGLRILSEIALEGCACQRDIINALKEHSNRTVIEALRKLVELGLLKEYIVVRKSGMRRVRMKCYRLTETGRWFSLLFRDPKDLDKHTLRLTLRGLLGDVVEKVMQHQEHLGLSSDDVLRIFCEKIMETQIRSREKSEPNVFVLGSVAIDHYVRARKKLPGAVSYYEYIGVFPGGSGANVAVSLSSLGVSTGFYGKIATDMYGLQLLTSLIRSGVNVNSVELDESKSTVETLVVLTSRGYSKILCMINDNSALSPQHLNIDAWPPKSLKGLYVGEVFHEVASEAMKSLQNENTIVIYRPLALALDAMTQKYLSLLRYRPILVLNREKTELLRKKGVEVPQTLFDKGAEHVIVTLDEEGAILFSRRTGEKLRYTPPRVKPRDTAGAGDVFAASLMHSLLESNHIQDAVRKACLTATLSTRIIGARQKAERINEVNGDMSEVKITKL